jgi:peptidoglycan/xylan/chitin deacetylase (PgdA/CDA1 family)
MKLSSGLLLFLYSALAVTASAQPSPPSPTGKAASPTGAAAKAAPPKGTTAKAAAPSPGKQAVKPPAKKPPPPEPAAYEVLFTFDDGPRYETTPKVLDTLDQYGVKSVFFVNGVRFMGKGKGPERARELLRETVRRGHLIGNHTVHHFFLCGKRGPTIAEREITENASLIQEAIGKPPDLFRTPFGSRCASLSETLKRLNIHPIGWDVDPQDWKLQDADRIYEFMTNALRNLRRPRSILLFHDIHQSTVDMLPRLLKWIAEENAQRKAAKRPPIQIIDYNYLLATNPPGAAAPSGPG